MEVEDISSNKIARCNNEFEEENDDVLLPGFRFYPTEEELISFYLKRKIEKRPIGVEFIMEVDIYKYEPWDLSKWSNHVGDKEWYFFCQRGRKYRNSIRPNRVTGSGFWKATGIDRPIYPSAGGDCIGLKKSLVYYRGSASKGTKTDWMLHEFRLPKTPKHFDAKTTLDDDLAHEAEIWTLCRIFKRNVSYRKCAPNWKSEGNATKRVSSSKTRNDVTFSDRNNDQQIIGYINFNKDSSLPAVVVQTHTKPQIGLTPNIHVRSLPPSGMSLLPLESPCGDITEFTRPSTDWEDLRAVVGHATMIDTTHPFNL